MSSVSRRPKQATLAVAVAVAAAVAACAPVTSALRLSYFYGSGCDPSRLGRSVVGESGQCTTFSGEESFTAYCNSPTYHSPATLYTYSGTQCNYLTAQASGLSNVCYSNNGASLAVECDYSSQTGGGRGIDPSGCFVGDAKVRLEDGREASVAELRPGDRVLSSGGSDGSPAAFDTVFRVTHAEPDAHARVVRIVTESGAEVRLTANHFVHTDGGLSLAGDVRPGARVYVAGPEAGRPARPSLVVSADSEDARGLYNVHTLSSNLVVGGVAASHFTTASTWGRLNAVAPVWYRALHALAPAQSASRLPGDAADQAPRAMNATDGEMLLAEAMRRVFG